MFGGGFFREGPQVGIGQLRPRIDVIDRFNSSLAVSRFGLFFLSSSLSSSLSFILLSALFQLFIDYFIQYGNPIQLMFDDAISAPLSRSGAFIV